MKYSLTLNFDSKEDLQAFLDADKAPTASSTTVAATAPKAAKKAAPKAKEEEVVVMPEQPKAAPAPFYPEAPKAAPVAPIVTTPIVAPPLAFDRNIVLANISATVNDLKTESIPDNQIAALFMQVFSKMGQAGKKISELDDSTLAVFNSHLYPEVSALRVSQAPKHPSHGSFI